MLRAIHHLHFSHSFRLMLFFEHPISPKYRLKLTSLIFCSYRRKCSDNLSLFCLCFTRFETASQEVETLYGYSSSLSPFLTFNDLRFSGATLIYILPYAHLSVL